MRLASTSSSSATTTSTSVFQPLDPAGNHDPAYRHPAHDGRDRRRRAPRRRRRSCRRASAVQRRHVSASRRLVLHPTSYEWKFFPVAGSDLHRLAAPEPCTAPRSRARTASTWARAAPTSRSATPPSSTSRTFTIETWFKRTGAGVAELRRGRSGIAQLHPTRHPRWARGRRLERRCQLGPGHQRRDRRARPPTSRTAPPASNHPISRLDRRSPTMRGITRRATYRRNDLAAVSATASSRRLRSSGSLHASVGHARRTPGWA